MHRYRDIKSKIEIGMIEKELSLKGIREGFKRR